MSTAIAELEKKLKRELELRQAAQAGKLEQVTALLQQGVDVNAKGEKSKRTALHWAASMGYTEIIHTLLEKGADRTLCDNKENTPLQLAQQNRHQAAIDVLSRPVITNSNTHAIEPHTSDSTQFPLLKKLLQKLQNRYRKFIQFKEQYITNLKNFNEIWKMSIRSFYNENKSNFRSIRDMEEFLKKLPPAFEQLSEIHLKVANLVISHTAVVEGFFRVPEMAWNTHSKKEKNLIFLASISTYIANVRKYRKELLVLTTEAINKLNPLKEFFEKEHIKNLKKYLKGYYAVSGKENRMMMEMSKQILSDYSIDLKQYCDFINTYFPENLINIAVSCETNTGEVEIEIRDKDLFFERILLYFKGMEEKILGLLAQEKDITIINPIINERSPEYTSFITYIESWIKDIFSKNLSSLKLFDAHDHRTLNSCYMVAQEVYLLVQKSINKVNDYSIRLFKEESQALRQKFLNMLEKPEKHPSFEDIQNQDKKRQKEIMKQQRAEIQSSKEVETTMLFQRKLQEESIIRKENEKKSVAEKLIARLSKNENKNITGQVIDLLEGKIKDLSEKEFLKIVVKLKISGYKKISDKKISVRDNKLTLTLDGFYSFSMHYHHGNDNAGYVDKDTIDHLKNMFKSVGITKEMVTSATVNSSVSKRKLFC